MTYKKSFSEWQPIENYCLAYKIEGGFLLAAAIHVDGTIEEDNPYCVSESAFDENELMDFFEAIQNKLGWEYGIDYKIELVPRKNSNNDERKI